MAAATHGLIRTAHAVRSLAAEETSRERRAELASGLAYWAARYQAVPGTPTQVPPRLPSDALADVPIFPTHLRKPRPTSIFSAVAAPGWFERDADGFTDPALSADLLGLLCALLVPLQIALILVAMAAFRQAWNVETERPRTEAEPTPA